MQASVPMPLEFEAFAKDGMLGIFDMLLGL